VDEQDGNSLTLIIMTITRSIDTTGLGLLEEPEASAVPDEASPLLQNKTALQSLSERWYSNSSTFLDRNAGLLLLVASHFFFSASTVSVQWLNRSEEHVPFLEVGDTLRTVEVLI
jgi:hypothetical protein